MAMTLANFLADVAAIYIDKGGTFGSGRLIGPGLVLTAGHVVDYPTRKKAARKGWQVRLLRDRGVDGAWRSTPLTAHLVWRGRGNLDLALVRVSGNGTPIPSVKPILASYHDLGTIDGVDAAGFPEAWVTPGTLRDYRVRGALRLAAQNGPYAWTVAPADAPDEPTGWGGMSGAGVCFVAPDDKLYLFGAVQQVPGNFSGGMLEIARVSDAFADMDFVSHLETSLGEKASLVAWVKATFYGFGEEGLAQVVERLKSDTTRVSDLLEQRERLVERTALSEKALVTVAEHLDVEGVPIDKLASAMIDAIDRLRAAQHQIQTLPSDNPIRFAAQTAAEGGEYHRAEKFVAAALNQISAVKCIDEGKIDQAIIALNNAVGQLGDLSPDTPIDDRIVQGYLFKTFEQAFSAKGDTAQARLYLEKALAVFQRLAHETIPEGTSATRFAEVMNGLGNLRAAQGQHREAINNYKIATSLVPGYAYAWHDMFLSYHALATEGELHIAEMRQALANTKRTGIGWPPFGPDYFARLDTMMAEIRKRSRRSRPSAPGTASK